MSKDYGLLDVLKDSVTGGIEWADPALAAQRFAICSACSRYRPTLKICEICYCYMPEKVKHQKSQCADPNPKW